MLCPLPACRECPNYQWQILHQHQESPLSSSWPLHMPPSPTPWSLRQHWEGTQAGHGVGRFGERLKMTNTWNQTSKEPNRSGKTHVETLHTLSKVWPTGWGRKTEKESVLDHVPWRQSLMWGFACKWVLEEVLSGSGETGRRWGKLHRSWDKPSLRLIPQKALKQTVQSLCCQEAGGWVWYSQSLTSLRDVSYWLQGHSRVEDAGHLPVISRLEGSYLGRAESSSER